MQNIGFDAQNRHAGFQVGRLNIGDQAPLKTGAQAFFQANNGFGRTITTDHNLLAHFVEAIEGVEELFLRRFLTRDKLNIVHEQDINRTVFGTKLFSGAIAYGIDDFVGKLLG